MADKIKKLLLFLSEDSEDAKKNKSKLEVKLNDTDFGKEKEIFVYYDFVKDGEKRKKLTSIKVKIPKKDDVPNPEPDTIDAIVAQKEFVIDNTNQDVTITLNGQDSEGEIVSYIWKSVLIEGQPVITIPDNQNPVVTVVIPKGLEFTRIAFQLHVMDKFGNIDTEQVEVKPKIDEPEPNPEPQPEGVIYDSNIDGKWDNGVKRTVTDSEGDISPGGKGLYTAASGNPRLILDGNGVGILECDDGHGRIYIKVKNYNAILETEFNILDDSVENFSQKLRSRHQEGSDCENRFGGVGFTIARPNVGHKIEKCHNTHEQGFDEILQKKLDLNTWYKSRFTCKDVENGILQKGEIDYNDGNGWVTVSETVFKNPPAYYVDKSKFDQDSYLWLRLNGSGRIAMRNVKVISLP